MRSALHFLVILYDMFGIIQNLGILSGIGLKERFSTQHELNDGPAKESTGVEMSIGVVFPLLEYNQYFPICLCVPHQKHSHRKQKQLSELYLALLFPWLHIAHPPPLLLKILENINILPVCDVRQGAVQAGCIRENEVPQSPW